MWTTEDKAMGRNTEELQTNRLAQVKTPAAKETLTSDKYQTANKTWSSVII